MSAAACCSARATTIPTSSSLVAFPRCRVSAKGAGGRSAVHPHHRAPLLRASIRSHSGSMSSRAAVIVAAAEAPPPSGSASTVLALDFDGVVCDSEPESSISGWKHGEQLWPDVFGAPSVDDAVKTRVLSELKAVRPVVETGFENTLLARALLEQLPGHSVDDIVAGWGGLMPGLMARWELDRGEMVSGYGTIRDDWMAADLEGWLAPNLIFPGVAEACIAAEESDACDVFIVTTKQARFASAIMRQKGNLHIPPERVFSQTVSGLPKTVVLADLAATSTPSARKVFVEDKLSTLEKVCATDGLEAWELFLVDWGYNTQAERERAAANPRITLLSIDEFVTMLRAAAAVGEKVS